MPLDLSVKTDPQAGTATLVWAPNPHGTVPVRYAVFAADEKGFAASRTPFRKLVGRGFCRTQEEFAAKPDVATKVEEPANLLAETAACSLQVVGPDLKAPLANRAFYRVVAVDAAGRESGPSDYAAVPRPFIWGLPGATAQVGQAWHSQPGIIRSSGDVLCRGGYNPAFWTPDVLDFALVEAPPWLGIDAASGVLSGTPPTAGECAVVWRVRNERGSEAVQRFMLQVTAP